MRFKSWLIFDYFKHVLNIYSNGNFPQIIDPMWMWIHFLSQEWNVLSKLPFVVSWIPLFVMLRFLDQRRSVGSLFSLRYIFYIFFFLQLSLLTKWLQLIASTIDLWLSWQREWALVVMLMMLMLLLTMIPIMLAVGCPLCSAANGTEANQWQKHRQAANYANGASLMMPRLSILPVCSLWFLGEKVQ